MKTRLLLTSCAFALISILPSSAAKYYLWTGSDPWGTRADGTKVEMQAGMFHTFMNSFSATDEIWIAAGTYTTSTSPAAIALKAGILVYGGFYGNETSISQRQLADETGGNGVAEPWEMKYPTIINGTGAVGGLANYVMFDGTTSFTLDGVTIDTHYVLARFGGAINNTGGSPLISNCIFRNINKSYSSGTLDYGGGTAIYVTGPATITACLFENNVLSANSGLNSGYGGTVTNINKAVTITRNVFRNNSVNGGTTTLMGSAITIGGTDTNTGLIANNVIYNNTSKNAAINFVGTAPTPYNIINNTIVNNFALGGNSSYVGGIYNIFTNAKIYNNVVYNNTYANNTTFKSFYSTVTVDLQNCAYNGTAGSGSFTGSNNNSALATPNFVDPSTTIGYTATMPADVRKANFALQAASNDLIDKAGYFAGITPTVDLMGNARSATPGTIDIGAYEYTGTSSIGEPLIKLDAQVFVNASKQITIIAPENCNYSIYNAMGQKLTEDRIINNHTIVDVKSFVSGL